MTSALEFDKTGTVLVDYVSLFPQATFKGRKNGQRADIQDFRDAIDYALGDPAKNRWAKMRAEAGQPKPFPLKYVEIGNENVGPEYVTHFNYIFKKLQPFSPSSAVAPTTCWVAEPTRR